MSVMSYVLNAFVPARTPAIEKVDWASIESANLNACYFDEHTQTLCVRYNGGAIYTFIGTAAGHYMALLCSPNVDKYVNHVLKAFPYTRWANETELLSHLNH